MLSRSIISSLPVIVAAILIYGDLNTRGAESKSPAKKLQTSTNSVGVRLVKLPGGTFLMGDKSTPNARPIHRVQLSPFWIGQYEVTNQQYELFARQTRPPESLSKQQPALDISWEQAVAFCKWLSQKEKCTYRLPTEAEWEYAARGGLVQRTYPWGDDGPEGRATTAQMTTTPVGSHAPNGFGLYDMAGNAMEWVSDWYGEDYYAHSPLVNPKGPLKNHWLGKKPPQGQYKILRGGAFVDIDVQCANRYPWALDIKPYGTGFRVVAEMSLKDSTAK